ncbi:MAG: divalent-cation tolerance protein CutA [Nanoarchaeota archaeon]|nr:divalent-cation tolerance protein CutA [Nanoarchaeota archaeon]
MVVSISVTCASEEEATKLAKTLVQEKLAACASIIPSVTSVYWWKKELHEDQEVLMIVKTKKSTAPAVTKRIKDLHSYEFPVITVTTVETDDAVAQWVEECVT